MKQSVERMGKTIDDAIADALNELGIREEDAIIEVLDEGDAGGLLGFGRRPARVLVSCVEENAGEDESRDDTELPSYDEASYGEEAAFEANYDSEEKRPRRQREHSAQPREDLLQLSDEEKEAAENKVVDFITSVLISLDIHGRISTYYDNENGLHIEVNGDDIGAAIGRRGETLEALQYLSSLCVNRGREQYLRVTLDIGHYRERRAHSLCQQARRSASRVLRSGRPYIMDPVPPAERRQIHMALADFKGVTTYSEGNEPCRYVVIAPDDGRE